MNQFRLPYHLIVEQGVFQRVPEVMKDALPGIERQKAVLVTEENLARIFPDVISALEEDFPRIERYLLEQQSYDNAVSLAKYITMHDISTVIGLGGGTVLDLAKFAAFVSKTRFISLPTTLSNDSLASPVAVLGTEGKARKSFRCTIPAGILVDTDAIMGAPVRQLLSGVGDTISKYTALNDWKLAYAAGNDRVDDFAYIISKMAFNSICYNDEKELKSLDFLKRLTQALVMGGLAMEIAGSSRPSSGSEHLFNHALEEKYGEHVNVPHGIAVAMGSYGACKFQGRNLKKIEKVIKDYAIPVRPSEWKITKELFVHAWQDAASTRPERYTILNTADLSDGRLMELYDEMEEVFASE